MSESEQVVVEAQDGASVPATPPDPGWAPPGTVPEGTEPPVVEEPTDEQPPASINMADTWGDPLMLARQFAQPVRQAPPSPPPQPEQDRPPTLDMARANVDLEGAMRDWSEKMTAYVEQQTQTRLSAAEARREAAAQADMVVSNLQIGSQMAEAVLGNEPAMQDPRVQAVVKQLIREAQVTAIDNPRASNAFRNEEFFVAILHRAKKAVGWQGRPAPVRMDAARTLSGVTSGRAPTSTITLSREEIAFCAREGISTKEYLDNKKAAMAEQMAGQAPWR